MKHDNPALQPALIVIAILASTLLAAPVGAQDTARVIASVAGTLTVPAVPGIKLDLAIKSLDVEIDLADGGVVGLNVITLWDSASRRFWWTFDSSGSMPLAERIADFSRRYFVLLTEQEIIASELASYPAKLWIARSTSVASTQNRVETKVFRRLANHAHQLQSWKWHVLREVDLTGHLPAGFCYDPWSSRAALEVEIQFIMPSPEGWEVHLKGREARTFRVVLSTALQFVGAEEVL